MPRKLRKGTDKALSSEEERRGTIVFFHPDLGIGGAERLVVDAAVGLQENGHEVVIFTNHCDPNHCFDECRDGTLDVRVRASRVVPPSILSRLTILCAIVRHLLLLLQTTITGELAGLKPRIFFADQLSAGLPLLRLLHPSVPILFYCHFPDLLLVRGRDSIIKQLYRVPFDFLEEWSMRFASAVAVNSNFTKGIVTRTWPRLSSEVAIKVIYPCVDVEAQPEISGSGPLLSGEKIILSINRFERKKDIGLSIRAFAAIPEPQRKGVRLILAGGYDARISENVEYHTELQSLADSLSLSHHTTSSPLTFPDELPHSSILFLLSVPNAIKQRLLNSARLLVYTPSNEHFGIVPLEAMLAKTPVLAANTGGPVETILDAETGWLRDSDNPHAWKEVMIKVLGMSETEIAQIGNQGRTRVRSLFGRNEMARNLETTVDNLVSMPHIRANASNVMLRVLNIIVFFAIGMGAALLFSKGESQDRRN